MPATALSKAPIGFVAPMVVYEVTITADSGGAGSEVIPFGDLPVVNFAFVQPISPNANTNHAVATSVFIDTANKQVKVFIKGAPAGATVKLWVIIGA